MDQRLPLHPGRLYLGGTITAYGVQQVLKRLRQKGARGVASDSSEESLLRIAFELGYYDHAHLTNEFSKYAGIRPSELSHFYKTGIAGENYF